MLRKKGKWEMHEYKDITQDIIGAAIEVHQQLGPGMLESVYQRCMEMELTERNILFESQKHIAVNYKGTILDEYFVVDLWFPEGVIVEIKAVSSIAPIHEAQHIHYLKLSKFLVGLLLNFHALYLKDGIKRKVN